MDSLRALLLALLIGSSCLAAGPAIGQESDTFPRAQIEQLVAPIALYPDALVAQILMAATYPLQVVEAARWLRQHRNVRPDRLETLLADKDWDPSVKSLTAFPTVLDRMDQNLEWSQDLGDAYLAQPDDVMDAIQRLRWEARRAGNLASSTHQKVIISGNLIVIEPAQSEVIYVPAYNPTVVYGPAWDYSTYYYPTLYSYPASYWYPSGYVVSNVLAFGIGVAIGGVIFGGLDWHHHDITVNRNINRWGGRHINLPNNARVGIWHHNPAYRGNVPYRNPRVRQRYRESEHRSARPGTMPGFNRPGTPRNVAPRPGSVNRVPEPRPGTPTHQNLQRGTLQRTPTPPSGAPAHQNLQRGTLQRTPTPPSGAPTHQNFQRGTLQRAPEPRSAPPTHQNFQRRSTDRPRPNPSHGPQSSHFERPARPSGNTRHAIPNAGRRNPGGQGHGGDQGNDRRRQGGGDNR